MLEIYVDGDACPVKDEVLRVCERHKLKIYLVSNSWLRGYNHPLIKQVMVAEGADTADDWIAEHIGNGDIVITEDVPLAARCVIKSAQALRPNGQLLTENSIGLALATRNLMTDLRAAGEITGGPRSFTKQNRSNFLNVLETTIQSIKGR